MRDRLLLLVFTSLFAVALAGNNAAFAQDDEEDPCSDPCAAGDEEGASGDEGATSEDSSESAGEAAGGGAYPVEYIARPRVLPKGAWEAGLDLGFDKDFSISSGLSFMYGIDDKLNVGASYTFSLKDFEAKGALAVGASYLVMGNESMQVRADASFGYHLLLETLGPITAGALVQYNLNDKMAVFSRPTLVVSPEIDLGLGAIRPIFITVPASFGYQVNSNIFAEVGTGLAVIDVSDAANGFLFADFIPVSVTGMYSLDNKIDVGVNLSVDLKADPIGDSVFYGLMARYRDGV